ncbi:hypothetical protein WA158_007824 [Blastocystis sp. Blastoise]
METPQKPKTQINYPRLTLILFGYLAMFIYGWVQGSEIVARKSLANKFPVDIAKNMEYIYPICLLVGTIIYNFFSLRASIITGLILAATGCIFSAFIISDPIFFASVIIFLFAYGCLATSLNGFGTVVFAGSSSASMMCLLHFFNGLGSSISTTTAPNIASLFSLGFHAIYAFCIGIVVIGIIMLFMVNFDIPEVIQSSQSTFYVNKAIHDYRVWFFSGIYVLFNYIENYVMVDLVEFIKEYHHDPSNYLWMTTCTYWFYTASRFFLGFVVDKVGHLKSLVYCLFAISVLLIITLICQQYGGYVVIITSIFVALLWPTLITISMDTFGIDSGNAICCILVISNIGWELLELLMVFIKNEMNYIVGGGISVVICLLSALILFWYSSEIIHKPIFGNNNNNNNNSTSANNNNSKQKLFNFFKRNNNINKDTIQAPLIPAENEIKNQIDSV